MVSGVKKEQERKEEWEKEEEGRSADDESSGKNKVTFENWWPEAGYVSRQNWGKLTEVNFPKRARRSVGAEIYTLIVSPAPPASS